MPKAIPFKVLQMLEEAEKKVEEKNLGIQVVENENLVDLEFQYFDQIFSFSITKYEVKNGNLSYTYFYKPQNTLEFSTRKAISNNKTLIVHLDLWLDFVKSYIEAPSPFADKYEIFYEEQFYEKYKILDDDADINPFSIDKQKVIKQALNKIEEVVNKNEINASDSANEKVIHLIEEVKSNLRISPKNVILKTWAKLLANYYKIGHPIVQGAAGSALYEIIKGVLN